MVDLSFCLNCIAVGVTLLVCANGAPVVARNLLENRLNRPIDLGRTWKDGRPVFGKAKTWRGLVAAILTTALIAPVLGLSSWAGGLFGSWAMAGDLCASFIKRRRGLVESSRSRMLDIIPESLLPGIMMHRQIGLGPLELVSMVGVFFLLAVLVSPILYRLRIRKRPY
jgi:CDP-diglyceride synthetase